MKKYLLVISFIGFLFGQDKYRFYLESDENLKLVGENYDIIKSELDKMLADYNSKIDLDNYWKVRNSERVFVRQERDLDAINNALEMDRALMAGMNIYEKKAHMDLIESYGTKNIYKDVGGVRNRIIDKDYSGIFDKSLIEMKSKWNDIVSFYGGYSELSKVGISKKDTSNFDIHIILDKIELTGSSTCLAHINIVKADGSPATDNALKFHKIPKSTYKYKGVYDIDYDKDYLTLYYGGNIWINVKFDKKAYLPSFENLIVLNKSILPSTANSQNAIKMMIDDLIPEKARKDPYFLKIKEDYLTIWSIEEFEHDLKNMELADIQMKVYDNYVEYKVDPCLEYQTFLDENFRGKVRKYKKAKKKELKAKEHFFKILQSESSYTHEMKKQLWEESLVSSSYPVLYFIKSYGFDPSDPCE